ncbi:zinc ABC transporter substrate-binding protein [Haloferax sp. MBLA0076]|uniref:Zinc ABC transporter substrate-binding protein n=1 Tax=Haloferax litoreum TaxID=2666140 RepID=A0A6A8GF22_9EURY|nr:MULTISPECIES: metal ABC transporter substrate-binding protein [Haloferax]KAB1193480.1 zinc ABC transporter substrate-binding protein [Haloferax sp. CBA1148]MRX21994.1 zinc ABC transporter substrate-binding protein [Haloferax litoreum]
MTNESRFERERTVSRRRVLAAGTGLVTAGLAGCLGGTGGASESDSNSNAIESDDGPVVVASFFSFYDFARKVAKDTPVTLKNLIPTGLHGHGWEPDASVTRDIIEADAFVHVGEDFQPWADRAIQTLKDDDVDTQLINVREGVELVELAASLDREEEGVGQGRGKDPHFWLDPQRAKTAVDNITEGLVELAPEYEDTFRDNAATYKTEVLDRIDRDYQRIFDEAERKVVQLAAHNAFQYIGVRYGVEMRPLVVNLAASGDVKPSDITEAKRVIDENDIKYVGAGVFETRKPAKQLIAETDVEAYYPVTPYAGVREDWVENDWGYEEIAYNINMPTFEIVLGNKTPDEVGYDGWNDEWRNFE